MRRSLFCLSHFFCGIFVVIELAVAVSVLCNLVFVIDAWADNRLIFLFVTGPEPARAVLFAELLLVADQPPYYRIQRLFVRVQHPAVLPGILFSPCPDLIFASRFRSPR